VVLELAWVHMQCLGSSGTDCRWEVSIRVSQGDANVVEVWVIDVCDEGQPNCASMREQAVPPVRGPAAGILCGQPLLVSARREGPPPVAAPNLRIDQDNRPHGPPHWLVPETRQGVTFLFFITYYTSAHVRKTNL
jgi:hypothetical protein